MAEAKAKVKARHREAIAAWLKWCEDNPKADERRRIDQFNACVDAAAISGKGVERIERHIVSGRN